MEGVNGDDDDNDRGGWVGYIVDERRPMGPRQYRMAEILLSFNFQIFATVESLDITGLSFRVRIVRVVPWVLPQWLSFVCRLLFGKEVRTQGLPAF